MRDRDRKKQGFTLIEMMVVVAIMGVLAWLAVTGLRALKPRASLASISVQLTGLLHGARQNAISTGRTTVVMVFPATPNPLGGTGRILLLEDGAGTFFGSVGTNFWNFDPSPSLLTSISQSELLEKLDLPRTVVFGGGLGAGNSLPAPYASIDVTGFCSFCNATRGAIAFDYRGRAHFYSGAVATELTVSGGSVSLAPQSADAGVPDIQGYRAIVVTAGSGGIRMVSRG